MIVSVTDKWDLDPFTHTRDGESVRPNFHPVPEDFVPFPIKERESIEASIASLEPFFKSRASPKKVEEKIHHPTTPEDDEEAEEDFS